MGAWINVRVNGFAGEIRRQNVLRMKGAFVSYSIPEKDNSSSPWSWPCALGNEGRVNGRCPGSPTPLLQGCPVHQSPQLPAQWLVQIRSWKYLMNKWMWWAREKHLLDFGTKREINIFVLGLEKEKTKAGREGRREWQEWFTIEQN